MVIRGFFIIFLSLLKSFFIAACLCRRYVQCKYICININCYKYKNNIKKSLITCGINSWLWHIVPTWHNFLFSFFLHMILVDVYLQLDRTSVIFPAHHFSLPFTFVSAANDFDLPSSEGYSRNNVKQFRKFLMMFSAKIGKEIIIIEVLNFKIYRNNLEKT